MKSLESKATRKEIPIKDKLPTDNEIAAKEKEERRWKAEWEVDRFADLPHNKVSIPH